MVQTRLSSLPALAYTLLVGIACSQPRHMENPTPQGPVIQALVPTEGPAGTAYPIEITITGTGFARVGNTVTFGDIVIADLPSTNDGAEIRFYAPKERPSTGEAPPFVLTPGHYAVTVTTPDGTSEPALFVFTRGPDA